MFTDLEKKINFINGQFPSNPKVNIIFNDLVVDFLNQISLFIAKNQAINEYTDLKTFGFWCRKRNIIKLAESYNKKNTMIGRGVVLHITPSNVALNFAYSLAFGLIAGNSNIVRLPSRKFNQVTILCEIIKSVLKLQPFNKLSKFICLIQYKKEDQISAELSKNVNARMIWGGDATIKQFKKYPTLPRCVDIMFSNRYSLCMIDCKSLEKLKQKEMLTLVNKFFNDSYLMDQQGCSSPHLVIWVGKKNSRLKDKFWEVLNDFVSKNYEADISVTNEKIIDITLNAITSEMKYNVIFKNFKLVRNIINEDFKKVEKLKGKFGTFSEITLKSIDQIIPLISNNIQTISYFGIDKDQIRNIIINNGLMGVDRIVPIGRAFDMSPFWDGFDIIQSLSRRIES